MINLFTAASSVTLLLLGQWLNVSHGFVCNNGHRTISTASSFNVQCWALPTPEESAQALTDYMAKSHEEKLKAVKAAEEKSKTEIESLKDKIKELESIPSSSAIVNTPPPAAGSVEEMSEKLVAYQKFMASYIVNAQEEKIKAVKAAEQAVSKKYEEKLSTFMLSGSAPKEEPVAAAIVVDENAPGSKLYKERTANVAAAAQAGKSRWGDKEVQKVSSTATSSVATTTTKTEPTASTPVPTPPEVTAADHGLRADGGVGGLTLAERVAFGAESKANGVVASAPTEVNGAISPMNKMTGYFNLRNAVIAAAAKAGKQSRWGGMEEKKAIEMAKSAPVLVAATPGVSPEVIAEADHGLGASGPSLADRVNLGASILNSN